MLRRPGVVIVIIVVIGGAVSFAPPSPKKGPKTSNSLFRPSSGPPVRITRGSGRRLAQYPPRHQTCLAMAIPNRKQATGKIPVGIQSGGQWRKMGRVMGRFGGECANRRWCDGPQHLKWLDVSKEQPLASLLMSQ